MLLAEALPGTVARIRPKADAAEIRTATVVAVQAPLRDAPNAGAGRLTELLFGERFSVFEEVDGWAYGQAITDGYVGYVKSSVLLDSASVPEPTHRVAVPLSHIYDTPDFKRPARHALPMCARLALTGREDVGFSEIAVPDGKAWVPAPHLRTAGDPIPDFADTALAFLGSPYLWGGRTITGIDCSGLVQVSLALAGCAVPRDSDMQEITTGETLTQAELNPLRRGDLVFFPRHVGIMTDGHNIVHANATFMAVTHEPLAALIERLKIKHSEPITSVRRLHRFEGQ